MSDTGFNDSTEHVDDAPRVEAEQEPQEERLGVRSTLPPNTERPYVHARDGGGGYRSSPREKTNAKKRRDPVIKEGFEVAVRQTVPVPIAEVWNFVVGDGVPIWLGDVTLPTQVGASFVTADGVTGSLVLIKRNSIVRVTWRPNDWPHDSALQISLKAVATGTVVEILHEQLIDREERRAMLGYWKNVLAHLVIPFNRYGPQ